MQIPALIFYVFSALMLITGAMVITARNPVHGILFLVATFISAAVLWLLLEAEFLALVLIFVYVGAVMTLFLFVIMMINIDLAPLKEGFVRYLPVGVLVMLVLFAAIFYALHRSSIGAQTFPSLQPENYSNVKELGSVLYTDYVYPFEIAAAILLVSIVASISLAFRGRQNRKAQQISQQVAVEKKDRLYFVDLKE